MTPTRRELRKEYRQELNKISMAYTSGRRHLSAVLKAGRAEAKAKYYMKLMENDYGSFWCGY
jgi:hypothetical protein